MEPSRFQGNGTPASMQIRGCCTKLVGTVCIVDAAKNSAIAYQWPKSFSCMP